MQLPLLTVGQVLFRTLHVCHVRLSTSLRRDTLHERKLRPRKATGLVCGGVRNRTQVTSFHSSEQSSCHCCTFTCEIIMLRNSGGRRILRSIFSNLQLSFLFIPELSQIEYKLLTEIFEAIEFPLIPLLCPALWTTKPLFCVLQGRTFEHFCIYCVP